MIEAFTTEELNLFIAQFPIDAQEKMRDDDYAYDWDYVQWAFNKFGFQPVFWKNEHILWEPFGRLFHSWDGERRNFENVDWINENRH